MQREKPDQQRGPIPSHLNFITIVDADIWQWKNLKYLIWREIESKAPICQRIIKKLCLKYGSKSERGFVHPQQVISFIEKMRGRIITWSYILAFIHDQNGSQHENTIRYIYVKFFVYYGRKRFLLDVITSARIIEQQKAAYSNVMAILLQIMQSLLERIEEGEKPNGFLEKPQKQIIRQS